MNTTAPSPVVPMVAPARDRHLLVATLLLGCVVIVRALLIVHGQSVALDEIFHFGTGLHYLGGDLKALIFNDPPIGAAIGALPAWLLGCRATDGNPFLHQPLSIESIRYVTAAWKALLLWPLLAVVFQWCRTLFGVRAGWAAAVLVAFEPTITAHASLNTLDILGVEMIVISCYLIWRYVNKPGWSRLVGAAISIGASMLFKHTAIILPGVAILYVILWQVIRPWRQKVPEGIPLRTLLKQMVVAGLIIPAVIWVLLFCDVHKPPPPPLGDRPAWKEVLASFPIPAYSYFHSIGVGGWHNSQGHPAYLWGEIRSTGWWYYFPAVALYKVPLGIFLVFVLALGLLFFRRPRWEELSLALPAVCWFVLLARGNINIGFRHFVPCYIFLILLSCRVFGSGSRAVRVIGAVGVAATVIHSLWFFPDYISYLNFPRSTAYLEISDSNLDWGQGLKEMQSWLDANAAGRKVHLVYFGGSLEYPSIYLTTPVDLISDTSRPDSGLLVISPLFLSGQYCGPINPWADLCPYTPDAVIGHALLVYDLDRLVREHGFRWRTPPSDVVFKMLYPFPEQAAPSSAPSTAR